MGRAERRAAKREKRTARTLREIDYLLMVDDEARQGALRFSKEPGGPFLWPVVADRIPPMVKLPRLLVAAEHFEGDAETEEDIRLLLAPGSSLGGARPKASVRSKNGDLLIAKFPHKTDETNVVLWEALALRLARKAGIKIPLSSVGKNIPKVRPVLERFDRLNKRRIPFLSAMSMLGAKDNETHSYLEVVDAIVNTCAGIDADFGRTVATHRLLHPDFQYGRSPAEPWVPICGKRRLEAGPSVRSKPGPGGNQAARAFDQHHFG